MDPGTSSDNVKVAVRVRPINTREKDSSRSRSVVEINGNQASLLKLGKGERKNRNFSFDFCFDSTDPCSEQFASQETVYSALGQDILDNAFKGYNACLFAYGQTGSGKSYTMTGSRTDPGIIPRLCSNLFLETEKQVGRETEIRVEVSYMEIYNEKVFDLLDLSMSGKVGLRVREHSILGPYVEGLSQLAVVSAQEIDDLMIEGNKSRTIAATKMNNESSRSHAVFTIILTFTVKDEGTGVVGEKVSRVSLVDLAGSERANKTGAVGERLKEGSNINKSLTTLGLVISKLADKSQGKEKENFVPYRDSVLTWLLKDSLGGNSRTVMVAALSPAEDNYEETLSTLRYADRAKRIKNHAVINEDPNARLITELRAEVEKLKSMLISAAQPDLLKEQLNENEELMKKISLTWMEKLAKTEKKQVENKQALVSLGLEQDSNEQDRSRYFLVNLNSDPALNEMLVYYLKDRTKVGSMTGEVQQDIQLTGVGIQDEHCILFREENRLYLQPLENARTFVNGKAVHDKVEIWDGDRILWGFNHFFRVNCPAQQGSEESARIVGWNEAQEEVFTSEGESLPLKDVLDKLQKKYEAEKLSALETQRNDYEKQFKKFIQNSAEEKVEEETGVINWLSNSNENRTDQFRRSLEALHGSLMKAVGLVGEANQISEDLQRSCKFKVTLQIPTFNLSPNNFKGSFMTEPTILLSKKGEGRQTWSLEKMETRIGEMRQVYQRIKEGSGTVDEIGKSLKDPFYEAVESHSLVGVANLYLSSVFHDIIFEHSAPIISQEGKIAGKLLLQVERIEGVFPSDRIGECDQETGSTSTVHSEEVRTTVRLRIRIRAAVGIPPALSHFLFCQYKFFKDEEYTVVPSIEESRILQTKKTAALDFRFEHERIVQVCVDEELLEYCEEGALSIEVYGHKAKGFYSAKEAFEQKRKAQVLADRYSIAHPDLCWICFDLNMKCHHVQSRWSELVRKLELWVEIHEIDEDGRYIPVEIQQREDVGTGGIYQLRHGQQRRMVVKVQPIHNTGNLPIVCDSILAVEVGNPVARSKLQRPLDSYQDEDLNSLLREWAASISRLKDDVDQRIHHIDEKETRTSEDTDLLQSLIDQKNCIVEELNAALVPGEASHGTRCSKLGMEKLTPVLFLNLSSIDSLESCTELDDYLPVLSAGSILPKEQGDKFFSLPILENLEKMIGTVTSWDSSVHNSVYLNRVTAEHERLFLIVKITLRITDPIPVDIILRKRICFSVYKRHSFVSKFRKSLGYSTPNLLKSTGVTYEMVGNVPNTFSSLESVEEDTEENIEDSFFDSYTQAVSAVETILNLERMKQQDLVLELLARKEASFLPFPHNLSKSFSTSTLGLNNSLRSMSLLNLGGVTRGNLSGSMHSLNQDTRPGRRSFEVSSEERKQKRLSLPGRHLGGLGGGGGAATTSRRSMMILTEEEDGNK